MKFDRKRRRKEKLGCFDAGLNNSEKENSQNAKGREVQTAVKQRWKAAIIKAAGRKNLLVPDKRKALWCRRINW